MSFQAALESFQIRTNLDLADTYEKLRTEYGSSVPSKAELAREIAEAEKEMDGCEAQVHRLQCHIQLLQHHRRRLDEYTMCLRSLMAPLRKLPNELMLRIFDWACEMNDLTSGRLQTMPALTISCVCSHWRDLAKSYPRLWSRICVDLTEMHLDRRDLTLLETYLELSQESPLSIEILGHKLETLEPRQAALCSMLGSYSERWQELIVSQPTFYKALLTHDPNHFPLLDSLTISNFGFRLPGSLDRFQDASRLQSLSLLSFPLAKVHKSNFPWQQLTSLNICSYSKEIKSLMEASSNLTELSFREWEDGTFKRNSFPVVAPTVRALSFSVSQTSHHESESLIDVVLSSTTFPALTSLYIDRIDVKEDYEHPWPKDIVQNFLSRSRCTLTTLSLKSIPIVDEDLIDLLRRLPSLLHLAIDDSSVTAHNSPITLRFIQSLHAFRYNGRSSSSSILVRKLQSLSLTFSGFGPKSFSDRDFVGVVSSRWYSGCYTDNSEIGTACLSSVVMRFLHRDVSDDVYAPLKHLEEAGMRVVILAQPKLPSLYSK
ncbi:hypothetical protein GYMLUDRAFT_50994 [Collybiopsis luxurians FD-317 M1]|uniref:F-box domain-containing protein n=1 Tax=Collybiopsis luxurians FD-317 M1 TaxID=944289 RepID=A0A0D0C7L0_9AGAR|nr:hypothetical protein GYMLUDRAFT_50994 [Collybiopsis luxurians FD-317 M1]